MILNVSGRCDIVAFYTEWFMNRYREGFVDVRNPFNPKLVSRISFENVDAILFCTKNPIPILKHLKEIDKPIIFHVTLTAYKNDIEPNVPDKKKVIEAIKELSKIVGIDNYKNVRKNEKVLKFREFSDSDYEKIGTCFSESAKKYGMTVQTCFEDRNLSEYGFIIGDCLSHEVAYKLTGKTYKNWAARKEKKCNCVQMVDIGVYNSCKHFCKYCYANYDEGQVNNNCSRHNPRSSLLIGEIENNDVIKERIK